MSDDWKSDGNKCYYLNKQTLSWRDADEYCKTQGGYLASIHSNKENSFVRMMVRETIAVC